MRQVLQVVSWTLSLTLNVLVLAELGKGLYRRFPFVFLYCIALLVSTTLEIVAVSLALDIDLYYWLDDVVRQGLMFTLVISLIHGAMEPAARRAEVRRWLVMGALAISAVSLAVHYHPGGRVGPWMTQVTRDLSFCSAVLDLLLWFVLVAARKKNYVLLMVSGALGLQFTAQAVGHALRQLAAQYGRSLILLWAGNICVLLANLVCLFLWWRTFRRANSNVAGTQADA